MADKIKADGKWRGGSKRKDESKKRRMPTADELNRIGVDDEGNSIHFDKTPEARSSNKRGVNQK